MGKKNFMLKRDAKKSKGIILITRSAEGFYVKEYKIDANKILIAPDAVDFKEFSIQVSKEEARKKINLPPEKKIVLYVGHLYGWKGVQTLAEASQLLAEDVWVIFVGGVSEDLKSFSEKNKNFKNVIMIGHKPHSEVVYWQKSADVLVLPNTAKKDISKYYTSPMKLFEYMASGVPIVASDLPSIREILNESNAVLVEPDNPEKLAEGVKKVLGDGELAEKISKQALADVQNYTWQKRARKILNFINFKNAESE